MPDQQWTHFPVFPRIRWYEIFRYLHKVLFVFPNLPFLYEGCKAGKFVRELMASVHQCPEQSYPGQMLNVIDTGNGILLKAAHPFEHPELDQVAGILKHTGKPVSLDQMDEVIKKGALVQK